MLMVNLYIRVLLIGVFGTLVKKSTNKNFVLKI